MAKQIVIQPTRTYASEANVLRALDRAGLTRHADLRFFIMRHDDGRYFPVFVGQSAVDRGVHFHFNVIG